MPPPRKSTQIIVGCLVILASAAMVIIAALVVRSWRGQSQITRADWTAAQRQWQQNGPQDYDITVEVGGRRAAEYRVEVRRGEAVSAYLDGVALTQPRLFGVWSVPGMFTTLEKEFRLQETAGSNTPGAPRSMRMYCQWDPQYGYPQEYRRLAGGGNDISWTVTQFIPLPSASRE